MHITNDAPRNGRGPLLGKGGVAAQTKKMSRSLLSGRRRGGWFKHRVLVLTGTTPSAPSKEASRYFINGAATPPPLRRGLSLPQRLALALAILALAFEVLDWCFPLPAAGRDSPYSV